MIILFIQHTKTFIVDIEVNDDTYYLKSCSSLFTSNCLGYRWCIVQFIGIQNLYLISKSFCLRIFIVFPSGGIYEQI